MGNIKKFKVNSKSSLIEDDFKYINFSFSSENNLIVLPTTIIIRKKGFTIFKDNKRCNIKFTDDIILQSNRFETRTFIYLDLTNIDLTASDTTEHLINNPIDKVIIHSDIISTKPNRLLLAYAYVSKWQHVGLMSDYIPANLYKVEAAICNTKQDKDEFVALLCSDLHGSSYNFQRIIKYAEEFKNISVILNAGDTVSNCISENDISWYTSLLNTTNIDIITTVGNHDAWTELINGSFISTDDTLSTTYNYLTKPNVNSLSDIVQPVNADTLHLNYYYKDYNNVRIINLDTAYSGNDVQYTNKNTYRETQNRWLKSVLDDAIIQDKLVMILTHHPFSKNEGKYFDESKPWVCYNDIYNPTYSSNYDNYSISASTLNTVDEFIDNGGQFICYLTGHHHKDNLFISKNHPRQWTLNHCSSNYSLSTYMITGDLYNNYNQYDSFSWIKIIPKDNMFILYRVGRSLDRRFNRRESLVIDYKERKIISINGINYRN